MRRQPAAPHNHQELLEKSLVRESGIYTELRSINETEIFEQVIGTGDGHTCGISYTNMSPVDRPMFSNVTL